MTKKEILQWIKDKKRNYPNSHGIYENGYFDALDIIKEKIEQLPEDEWIGFNYNPEIKDLPILVTDGVNYWVETEIVNNKFATNWKRIYPPTKPLPTKAEILEKLGLSEEELKEIMK
jgi:hypothetical protein